MKKSVGLLLMVVLGACSSTGDTVLAGPDTLDMSGVADVGMAEIALPDGVEVLEVDLPGRVDQWTFDTGPDLPFQACDPGEGCFLDPCAENSQCQSGWCVEHMGEGICTQLCTEECPPGWTCNSVGSGPDLNYICVSGVANLCKPCATTEGCKAPGGADDVCVDYGEEGSYCGGACTLDQDCPWGFSCLTTVTVDGIATLQCVADAGVCPCTGKSIELSLSTPCEQTTEFGTCLGKRYCSEEGLTACDAKTPAEEVCNGLDDNCDGDLDEDSCDDDNACTADTCLGEEGCQHEPLEAGECFDGNPCTVADHCVAGECIGTPALCNDDNPCTDDSCDETGGCIFTDNTAKCDDGDVCTVGDLCDAGLCAGYSVNCQCESDIDCAQLEDDDVCNGTLVCDTNSIPHLCVVDPGTVKECPVPQGLGAFCLAAVCDSETGACSIVPANEGFSCNDTNACTMGEYCVDGECSEGIAVNCNDGNLCTDDVCDPQEGCKHTPNAAPCNDSDPCTTNDFCTAGNCVGGSEVDCDDGDLCNGAESCDQALGCIPGEALTCDDGDICNGLESCHAQMGCQAGIGLLCADNNLCNGAESCDPVKGCQAGVPLVCDDSDLCNGIESCEPQVGCLDGVELLCDDSNVCTDNSCHAKEGCIFAANEALCDDGNACTIGDHCAGGKCLFTGSPDCDDSNVCTKDSCDPDSGCAQTAISAACDDGDPCTINDQCADGACGSGPQVDCDDGNPCTDDTCNEQGLCEHLANAADCNDGNECTVGDHCADGNCSNGGLVNCDDKDVCTTDSCDPAEGCVHLLNNAPCDDEDVCTTGDHCQLGECEGGGELNCNDGNLCTDDSCNPQSGCTFTPNAAPCNDGNACTTVDLCAGGGCFGSQPPDCDDQKVCTTDSCDIDVGCVSINNTVGCNDGNLCTTGDICADGSCQPGDALNCDDSNGCTDDSCAPDTGCVNTPNTDGCDDDNACTANDICANAECDGDVISCGDNDSCTTDTCNADTGCVYTPISPCCGNGVKEAGEACDDGNDVAGDGCENNCTSTPSQKCSVVAKAACAAKGWQYVGGTTGNIVCTIDGRGTGANCDTCSTYNIFVWQNGSKELHCLGHNYSTVAGKYYSAHTPCVCGNNLDLCGSWDMKNCTPD
jgi:hypothetical protein